LPWLVLGVAAFYLLTGSRERPWSDATPIYEVADSLVSQGTIAISTPWPVDLKPGRQGRTYAVAPLLPSLIHVPGAGLRRMAGAIWPASRELTWPFAAHLAPAALGGVTCALFVLLAMALGFSPRVGLVGAGMLAFASTLWVYARYPYGEILQAACFTWFFLQVVRITPEDSAATPRSPAAEERPAVAARRRPSWLSWLAWLDNRGMWLGLAAGLLVNSKTIFVAALPGAGLFLLVKLWPDRRRAVRVAGSAALAFAPLFAVILAYNAARWGSPLRSGYDLSVPVFTERPLFGLWGMFLSPGKSAFLYSPPLLLALVALPRAIRRIPSVLWLLLLTAGPVLLIYSAFIFWSGDYAWGPRYLVFAVPVLFLPALCLIEDLQALPRGWGRRARLGAVGVVLGAGLFVQVLGNTFHWDHFIRIAREARSHWLGFPNRSGSPIPPRDEICGACFEDMHPIQWLPPFSPIEGHLWLARHVLRGDTWQVAEAAAPWRRYTSLQIFIGSTYPRARIDWWFLDYPPRRLTGVGLVVLGLLGTVTVGAAAVGRRRLMRRD
jgi:hypothetical protein